MVSQASQTGTTHTSPADWARWFVPALLVALVLDLATKAWVFALPQDELPGWMAQHWNTGVAWSMFHEHPGFVTLLTAVLIPILGAVWWRGYRGAGPWENLAFGMILGGALGNGWDRLCAFFHRWPGVRDFISIDLGVWPAHPWPTFNIADSAITIGFVLLLARSFARPAPRAATAS